MKVSPPGPGPTPDISAPAKGEPVPQRVGLSPGARISFLVLPPGREGELRIRIDGREFGAVASRRLEPGTEGEAVVRKAGPPLEIRVTSVAAPDPQQAARRLLRGKEPLRDLATPESLARWNGALRAQLSPESLSASPGHLKEAVVFARFLVSAVLPGPAKGTTASRYPNTLRMPPGKDAPAAAGAAEPAGARPGPAGSLPGEAVRGVPAETSKGAAPGRPAAPGPPPGEAPQGKGGAPVPPVPADPARGAVPEHPATQRSSPGKEAPPGRYVASGSAPGTGPADPAPPPRGDSGREVEAGRAAARDAQAAPEGPPRDTPAAVRPASPKEPASPRQGAPPPAPGGDAPEGKPAGKGTGASSVPVPKESPAATGGPVGRPADAPVPFARAGLPGKPAPGLPEAARPSPGKEPAPARETAPERAAPGTGALLSAAVTDGSPTAREGADRTGFPAAPAERGAPAGAEGGPERFAAPGERVADAPRPEGDPPAGDSSREPSADAPFWFFVPFPGEDAPLLFPGYRRKEKGERDPSWGILFRFPDVGAVSVRFLPGRGGYRLRIEAEGAAMAEALAGGIASLADRLAASGFPLLGASAGSAPRGEAEGETQAMLARDTGVSLLEEEA